MQEGGPRLRPEHDGGAGSLRQLAVKIGARVIAEGVEREEERETLRKTLADQWRARVSEGGETGNNIYIVIRSPQ